MLGSVSVLGSEPCAGLTAGHWDRLGQCSQQWLELVRLLVEGRIFPPLKPPWCRGLLQVRFASDCLALLWLPCPSMRGDPQSVVGPEGTALLEKCHLLGCTRAPQCPQTPKAVLAALGKARLWPWHTQDPSLAATTKFLHQILALAWHCKAGGMPRE